jgi:hypothetical protein
MYCTSKKKVVESIIHKQELILEFSETNIHRTKTKGSEGIGFIVCEAKNKIVCC